MYSIAFGISERKSKSFPELSNVCLLHSFVPERPILSGAVVGEHSDRITGCSSPAHHNPVVLSALWFFTQNHQAPDQWISPSVLTVSKLVILR